MPARRMRKMRGKKRAPRRGGRKSKMPAMPSSGTGQNATIVETITLTDDIANTAYTNNFDLSQFTRASALAPNFQYYKAAKCVWEYTPLYNTFQDGLAGTPNASKPYFYSVMNRTQLVSNFSTLAQLQAMGARPTKFISIKKIAYKPNWCSPGLIAQDANNPVNGIQQLGMKQQYDWLVCPSTYPGAAVPSIAATIENATAATTIVPGAVIPTIENKVTYNGHAHYVEQKYGDTQPISQVTLTVHWVFKGANFRDNKGSVETPALAKLST